MKKLFTLLFVFALIGCDNSSSKKSSVASNEPSYYNAQYGGSWDMILEMMKNRPYNPNGYIVTQPDEIEDDYGNVTTFRVQAYPLVRASKEFVNEVKKFADIRDIYKARGLFSYERKGTKAEKMMDYVVNSLKPYFNASNSKIKASSVYWDLPYY